MNKARAQRIAHELGRIVSEVAICYTVDYDPDRGGWHVFTIRDGAQTLGQVKTDGSEITFYPPADDWTIPAIAWAISNSLDELMADENFRSRNTFELTVRGNLKDLWEVIMQIQDAIAGQSRLSNDDRIVSEFAYKLDMFQDDQTLGVNMIDQHKDLICGNITARPTPGGSWLTVWHDPRPPATWLWDYIYSAMRQRGFFEAEPPTELARSDMFSLLGISSDLLHRLRTALPGCGPFDSDSDLRAIFIDQRICAWRNALLESASVEERVNNALDFLLNRKGDDGENALVLFLRVLGELKDSGDACKRELVRLADDLGKELQQQ